MTKHQCGGCQKCGKEFGFYPALDGSHPTMCYSCEADSKAERRCEHVLSLGDYPKQCRKCMKMVLDGNSFLGGDRRKSKILNTHITKANSYDLATMPLIWANRFVNIGLGRHGTKLCNEAQAECMQKAMVEAFNAGKQERHEK